MKDRIKDQEKQYWFPARRWGGWGWGVANCWRGTLVQLGYPILVFLAFSYFVPRRQAGLALLAFAILTVALVVIHWVKGERPTWRW